MANAPGWRWLLVLGAVSRVLVVVFGLLVGYLRTPDMGTPEVPSLEASYPNVAQAELLSRGSRTIVEPWYRFDADWYAEILRIGYVYEPNRKCTAAFMPFLSVCMAGAERVGIDPYWAGLILPNLAFVVGFGFFGKWAFDVTQDGALTRRACWLVAAFPTALFFSAPYQEAFAFCFCSVALWAWRRDRILLTALALAIAGTARLTTLAVGMGLFLEWLQLPRDQRKPLWKVLFVGIGNIAGVLLFCVYLQRVTGEFFAHPLSHVGWGRMPPSWAGFVQSAEWILEGKHFGAEVISTVGFLALGIRAWVKRGFLCGFLILFPVIQALSTGSLMSMQRITLACFPAFIEMADCLRSRTVFRLKINEWLSRWLFRVSLGICVGLQMLMVYHYINWWFVG